MQNMRRSLKASPNSQPTFEKSKYLSVIPISNTYQFCALSASNVVVASDNSLFQSYDGRTSWIRKVALENSAFPASYRAVDSHSGKDVFIGGSANGFGGTILSSRDSGSTWLTQAFSNPFGDIRFFDSQTAVPVSRGFEVWISYDTCKTWTSTVTPSLFTLNATCPISWSTIIGVGPNGTILRSNDSCLSWVSLPQGTAASFNDVCFRDSLLGLCVGDSGIVLRTTDGGLSWVRAQSPAEEALSNIAFSDLSTWYAVGNHGTVIKSEDSGNTFAIIPVPINANFTGVSFSEGRGYISGERGIILRLNPLSDTLVTQDISLRANPARTIIHCTSVLDNPKWYTLTGRRLGEPSATRSCGIAISVIGIQPSVRMESRATKRLILHR
jgi:photosystem II stability/assembly factor-like uncharacterized protein